MYKNKFGTNKELPLSLRYNSKHNKAMNNTQNTSGQHTKGEWHSKEGQIYPIETGKTLAVIPYFDKDNQEQEANARLISAAPELLEALQNALSIIERMDEEFRTATERHSSYTKGEHKAIQAAINKATI